MIGRHGRYNLAPFCENIGHATDVHCSRGKALFRLLSWEDTERFVPPRILRLLCWVHAVVRCHVNSD